MAGIARIGQKAQTSIPYEDATRFRRAAEGVDGAM